MEQSNEYKKGFIPYALAAFLIGIVGGFSTVLGPSFVQDIGIAYNNTTWTALAQAMSTAACAPILGKVGDVVGRKRTLLLGIAVFTLGNVLSALANSLVFMMIARFVVGIGTAAMTPVIMAYIVTNFPPKSGGKGLFYVYADFQRVGYFRADSGRPDHLRLWLACHAVGMRGYLRSHFHRLRIDCR